ncbi:MAG: ATP-binding protein, partial [Bacteroidales bacterium]|nr:ATP-binding protein [Bacteroidales bacterium]
PELSNWTQAFRELRRVIVASRQKRKVVFIDEMPWMDTPKSGFVSALDHFWNQWASARKDVVLVICGSATSWIIDKVIKDRGGLHNRVTDTIELLPFTLRECEEYAASKRLSMSRKEIAETYMVLGGVPYYWSFFVKELDPVQNIDALCFARGGKLRDEFSKLYRSLFKSDEGHYKIIEALGRKKAGMSREEILKATGLQDGGTFTKNLEELDQCGFIRRYTAPGKKKKDALYQLFDNFTLFYFKFMEGESNPDPNFWQKTSVTQAAAVWKGLAFERVCMLHVEQIKKALGISGILTHVYGWCHDADDTYPQGAQIDLLIERGDSAYNVCEMKFSDERYV